MTIIPYPEVDGQPFLVNDLIVEALGLKEFTSGWSEQGFDTEVPEQLQARLDQINWKLVAMVDSTFHVSAPGAESTVPTIWITERRFVRLLKRCLHGMNISVFQREFDEAMRVSKIGTVSE